MSDIKNVSNLEVENYSEIKADKLRSQRLAVLLFYRGIFVVPVYFYYPFL